MLDMDARTCSQSSLKINADHTLNFGIDISFESGWMVKEKELDLVAADVLLFEERERISCKYRK
jgi:hypothetical protein